MKHWYLCSLVILGVLGISPLASAVSVFHHLKPGKTEAGGFRFSIRGAPRGEKFAVRVEINGKSFSKGASVSLSHYEEKEKGNSLQQVRALELIEQEEGKRLCEFEVTRKELESLNFVFTNPVQIVKDGEVLLMPGADFYRARLQDFEKVLTTLSWKAQLELQDGSRLLGTLNFEEMSVVAEFATLKVPLKRIRNVRWLDDGAEVVIGLNNDDELRGKPGKEALSLKAVFGEVELPVRHVKSMQVWTEIPHGILPSEGQLVLHYRFDRQGNNSIKNRVNADHVAANKGGLLTKNGRRGGGVTFNATGRLETPHHEELCPKEMSVGAWIKPTGDQGQYQIIIAKTNPSSWQDGFGMVRMPGDPKNVHFFINGYRDVVVKAEVPNDKWSFVLGVCDGKKSTLYVNGEARETVKMEPVVNNGPNRPLLRLNRPGQVQLPPGGGIAHCTSPLWIGSDSSGYAWRGQMDDLVFYRRALNEAEVKQLYGALMNR